MLIQLDNLNTLDEKWSGDCRINSVYEMLHVFGADLHFLTKPRLAAISGGVCSTFSIFGDKNLPVFSTTEADIEAKILSRIGLAYKQEELAGDGDSIRKIRSYIEQGVPVLAKTAASALSNKTSGKFECIGTPLIYGYKGANPEEAVLFWTNAFHDTQPFTLPWDVFTEYRAVSCLPYSPDFRCITVDIESNLQIFSRQEIEDRTDESIEEMILSTADSKPNPMSERMKSLGAEVHTGLEALEAFSKYASQLSRRMFFPFNHDKAETELRECCKTLYLGLSSGSLSAYREETADLLETHRDPEIRKRANELREVGAEWRKLDTILRKAERTHDIHSHASRIKSAASAIEKSERKTYLELAKTIRARRS